MDNPQHYQPLSHALHPPLPTNVQSQATYSTPNNMYNQKLTTNNNTVARHEEEEEEEEEEDDDDDDVGIVEEQLSRNEPENQTSNTPSSPRPSSAVNPLAVPAAAEAAQRATQEPERKRRPGRPRGSKNRKPRVGSTDQKSFHYQGTTTTTTTTTNPPQHPEVSEQNQPYYEFQWRVLNLCAEFYGAAEELVKATPPLVVAQCYHMGPGSKVDPLVMLNDAKRICDTLLSNPSQLVSNPPPPMYPTIPSLTYQPSQIAPVASTSAGSSTSAGKPPGTTGVISNPQTFVVALGSQPTYSHPQYPVYATPPGQYPTTPYYHQYTPYAHPGSYYAQSQPVPTTQTSTTTGQSVSATTGTISTSPSTTTTTSGVIGNQGAWSDEETERLKKLAEESKSVGSSGDIEWDWVVHQWGAGRTRHQILIKATALGLKESSSRGLKRRRDTDGAAESASPSVPQTPNIIATTTSTAPSAPTSASPAQSQSASTPAASPALQHQQRPPSSKGLTSSVTPNTTSNLPWPMPTVAVNTPPVIPTNAQDQQRTSYYRPRPNQTDPTPKTQTGNHHPTAHHYMYQPNGNAGSGSSSRLGKENGK